MGSISHLSDSELLTRLPELVLAERAASAEVVEHLVEVERRRLYLEQACSSLNAYCRQRLAYSEDGALKRARVAKLTLRLPRALDELRRGAIHLTGLFLLSSHLTEENAEALFAEARGKSRRELELLLACRFPRPEVAPKVQALGATPAGGAASPPQDAASGPSFQFSCPGTAQVVHPRVEPLSAERYRYEVTGSAQFHAKLELARELQSHVVPSGDPALILELGLDALLEGELKRRHGAGKPRKRQQLKPNSRHVPVDLMRQVWERDGGQCTFEDAEGRRCTERRFITVEHRHPFALGGPPTLENLCLYCSAHNAYTARQVFGAAFIEHKRAERAKRAPPESTPTPDVFDKVQFALREMGFGQREVQRVLADVRREQATPEVEPLLRAALNVLTPMPRSARASSSS
jgi:hypothetical protein